MSYKRVPVLVLLAGLMFAGCVTLPPITANPSSPIRTIAVLPMVNNTTDVDAPAVVREIFTGSLGSYYYIIKPLAETDQVLKDQMGVTLGSQLDMAKPQQLGEKLGVDAVFYGSVEDFSHKITGIYNVKRVRARVKLVDCKTGETIWKNGIGVKQALRAGGGLGNVPFLGMAIAAAGAVSSIASSMSDKNEADLPLFLGEEVKAPWHPLPEQESSLIGSAVIGIGGKVLSKALNSPLRHETETASNILLHGYYHDGGPFSSPVTYGGMIPTGPGEPEPAAVPTGLAVPVSTPVSSPEPVK
jgi:hypothetical protein